MIGDFIESWSLFGTTYAAALLIALSASWLGVLVVTRRQIFVAASISQASLLGIALSLVLGWSDPSAIILALSIGASLLMGRGNDVRRGDNEEMTGWVFLAASSGAVLLLAHHANGMRELQAALASTMIGATAADVWTFAFVTAGVGIAALRLRREIALFILDPVMAAAVGMNIALWSVATSVAVGLTAGLAIKASGMLYTFGCFVLPALTARNFSKEVGTMIFVAPAVALVSVTLALALSNAADLPPGQAAVATMAVVLMGSRLWKRTRESMEETPLSKPSASQA